MNKVLVAILVVLLIFTAISGVIAYNMFFREAKEAPTVSYDPGDEFLTNLKGDSSFVKVDIIIETKDNKKIKYMTENNYKIRDSILYVLRTKTRNDMNKDSAVDELKSDIRERLKNDLNLDNIVNIYFQEFIIQ